MADIDFRPGLDWCVDTYAERRGLDTGPRTKEAYHRERQAYYTARNEHIQRVRWDKGRLQRRGGYAGAEKRLAALEGQCLRLLTALERLTAELDRLRADMGEAPRARVRTDGGGK